MALCPFARQEPVVNHGGAVAGHVGCVIHVTAGESDPGGWFNNPASQVSAHFGIGNGQGGFADGQCLVPEHRVLTADLRWVPGGSLSVGDRLVGFDEHPIGDRRRKYRTAVVESVGHSSEPVYGVVLDDEQVIYTTAEHRWLAQRNESWVWRMTKSADQTLVGARLPRLFDPWGTLDDFPAGWFAGFLDGEGTVTNHHRVGFSQRPTAVLDHALEYLDKGNIAYTVHTVAGGSDCRYVDIQGGLPELLRFLGSHRPIRLLKKVDPEGFGMVMRRGAVDDRRVLAVYPAGVREIVKVQTSTKTFIAEGYPMHNCVQYVDTDLQSWAEMAGNATYVSVETEGEPTEALTQNQILTFARLYAWLHGMYGFPFLVVDIPGQAGLITHGDGGAAWGGHYGCPGSLRSAQRAQIVYLAAISVNPQPVTKEAFNMQCEDPVTGGIWTLGADGHVEAEGGAPYCGGMGGNRWTWQSVGTLAGFSPRKDGSGQQGYDVAVAVSKANPDGTWFDHYTFPRNGSLKAVAPATAHHEDVLPEGVEDVASPTGR